MHPVVCGIKCGIPFRRSLTVKPESRIRMLRLVHDITFRSNRDHLGTSSAASRRHRTGHTFRRTGRPGTQLLRCSLRGLLRLKGDCQSATTYAV